MTDGSLQRIVGKGRGYDEAAAGRPVALVPGGDRGGVAPGQDYDRRGRLRPVQGVGGGHRDVAACRRQGVGQRLVVGDEVQGVPQAELVDQRDRAHRSAVAGDPAAGGVFGRDQLAQAVGDFGQSAGEGTVGVGAVEAGRQLRRHHFGDAGRDRRGPPLELGDAPDRLALVGDGQHVDQLHPVAGEDSPAGAP